MISEVVENVFVADHRTLEGKNGIVLGSRGALVIDTGCDLKEGAALADFVAERTGRPADRVVLTSGHEDHIWGLPAFPEAEIFASVHTPDVLARTLAQHERPLSAIRQPTITFTGELQIDLGGKTVKIFPTPGHSADSLAIYVIEDRLLFAGDTVVSNYPVAIGDGDSRQLEASLRHVATLPIDTIVCGHGPLLTDPEQARDWLLWQASYLLELRDFVQFLVKLDVSIDVILSKGDFEQFVKKRLSRDVPGMERRHLHVIGKIVAEERVALGKS